MNISYHDKISRLSKNVPRGPIKTNVTLRMRNYLKFPTVKVIVKEIAYKSLAMKHQFSRPNDVGNVSKMCQSVQNIKVNH